MPLAGLDCPLRAAARAWGAAPALQEGDRVTDFATLDRQVAGLAAWLRAQGVTGGQRLLLASDAKGELVRLLLACLRLGACAIPVNPRFPAAQRRAQLTRSAAHWRVDIGACDDGAPARRLALPDAWPQAVAPEAPRIDPHRPLTGVFTSGSSGAPKLALHSFANHRASADGSRALIPLGPGDRWALTLPLYHVGGLAIVFRCLLAGACLQIPVPDQGLAALVAGGATHLSAVATQLVRLQAAGVDLAAHGLRYLLLGGSAFPGTLLDWLAPQPLAVLISYGLTEMGSQVMTGPVNPDGRLATLLPGRELTLSGEGEILVRGDTLFLGYFDDGRLERPLDADGWFHTRDLGTRDPQGGLRVRGRRDNQFISGGENLQPEAIEAEIGRFAGVGECYVVPVADAEFGQRPVAFVAWEGDAAEAALLRWLRSRLPGYQRPVAVLALTAADRPAGLKVSRPRLAERAAERLAGAGQPRPRGLQ